MVLLTGFYITDMSRQRRKTNMEVNPFPLTLLARPTLHGTSKNTRSFPMSSMKLVRAFLSTWSEAPVQIVRLRGKRFKFSISWRNLLIAPTEFTVSEALRGRVTGLVTL